MIVYKLLHLSGPLFPHLENGKRLPSALEEVSTEYVFRCIEYYYGYYSSHTSVNMVEYNNLGKEAHLPFCGWAHKTRHPSSVQSLQQSFTKHLLCAKNSYHSHPGCGGAARKGGAPLVNAQPSSHSRPGLLSNPSMGRG